TVVRCHRDLFRDAEIACHLTPHSAVVGLRPRILVPGLLERIGTFRLQRCPSRLFFMPERAVVVLDGTRFAEVAALLGDAVVQLLPPRLMLVDSAEELPDGAFDVDQVEFTPTAAEKLFVEASRKRMGAEVRPGDGLPWDAPGFTPPG
ncbi:MAG TPA: hypothetical protein VF821_09995, partial [Lentzea sp.]